LKLLNLRLCYLTFYTSYIPKNKCTSLQIYQICPNIKSRLETDGKNNLENTREIRCFIQAGIEKEHSTESHTSLKPILGYIEFDVGLAKSVQSIQNLYPESNNSLQSA